jgi:hypothetical protein
MTRTLTRFQSGYVEAILWLITDEDGEPMDELTFSDVADETLDEIVRECEAFASDNGDDLTFYSEHYGDDHRAGMDFFLTRNRHGAGFWDRDFSEPGRTVLARLTDAAHVYGETWEYVGDDGKVYSS